LGFRAPGLNFDQSEIGFLSTFTAQSVRIIIFFANQMNSVFLWSICCDTQCIRNQHSQFFLLEVKGLGVPFRLAFRLQVHVLSTRTHPCVVWTRCSHQQFDSSRTFRPLDRNASPSRDFVSRWVSCGWVCTGKIAYLSVPV
jgi:hypothetical protein